MPLKSVGPFNNTAPEVDEQKGAGLKCVCVCVSGVEGPGGAEPSRVDRVVVVVSASAAQIPSAGHFVWDGAKQRRKGRAEECGRRHIKVWNVKTADSDKNRSSTVLRRWRPEATLAPLLELLIIRIR